MRNSWTVKKVSDFGEIITGSTPSTKINEYWNGNYPFYSPADFDGKKYCSSTERQVSQTGLNTGRILKENSILFTCIGSIGKMAISTKTGISNQQINAVTVNKENDYEFVYYLLNFHKEKFKSVAPMTTIQIINKSDFGAFRFSIPPSLNHQRKIAKILNTVDVVIEKTETAIAKYKVVKQGMMQDLFTRGIDPQTGKLRPNQKDAPELYKETELGWIPKEWEVKQLNDFLYLKSGDGITSINIRNHDKYKVYGGNGLRGYTNTFTHYGEFVLIGRQGALCGNITYVNGKFYASEHAVVVTILDESNYKWVEHKLFLMNLNKYSEASAQPGLSVSKIQKLKISVPKAPEQEIIASRLKQIDQLIQEEQANLSKHQSLKKGLMQDLLTGKVEVEV
jgi:type I restriction enzyme S subunit|tara:strand:- start:1385 stop:2566 length:1182 start_codon:yes stop_codon:yes gene_type:complete